MKWGAAAVASEVGCCRWCGVLSGVLPLWRLKWGAAAGVVSEVGCCRLAERGERFERFDAHRFV